MRTRHLGSNNGFFKTKLYDMTNKRMFDDTNTMISEFGSASGFTETQKGSTGYYRVTVSQPTQLGIITWHNCNQNRCGYINDADGMEEFVYVKLGGNGEISHTSNSGSAMIQSGGWRSWNSGYHRWMLPTSGRYLLFFTLRTYQSNWGWGKMRVVNNYKGAISESERMITEYSGGGKAFSFTNHVASGVYMYDNSVAGSYCYTQYYATTGGIGWQSDSNGHNHFVAVKIPGPFFCITSCFLWVFGHIQLQKYLVRQDTLPLCIRSRARTDHMPSFLLFC